MSRITKAILAVFKIIRNPWLLNHVLQQPEIWEKHVVNKYGIKYGLGVVSPEDLFGEDTKFDLHPFLYHVGHTKSALYFPQKLNKTKLKSPVFPEAFYKVGIKYQKIED